MAESDIDLRRDMIELISACWSTQVAGAAARLKVPDALAAGPIPAAEVAARIDCPPDSTQRLLRAMCSLGLARQVDAETFASTPRGDLLRAEVPGSMRGMAMSWTDRQWISWSMLEKGVRTGEPTVGGFDTVAADPVRAKVINQAQADRSRFPAAEVAASYDFSGVSRVLDVGGGMGAVLAAILSAHPRLTGAVFDLAYIEADTRAFLAAEGVGERAGFVGGSFFDEAPAGYDLIVLKSILHDWPDEECRRILSTCAAAAPGARVLIVEQVLPEIATDDPADHSAFRTDLTMLLGTGGRERTEREFRDLLKSAGLTLSRIVPNRSEFSLIEAVVD